VTVLHHLAQAAAVILLVELLVVLMLFLALAGGLAFGSRWVRGKSGWAFEHTNEYLPLVSKYTGIGTDLVAKPFILGGGAVTRVQVTLASIRRQVREHQESSKRSEPLLVASRPVDPEATVAVPAVSDETTALPLVEATPRS
jgi:hypothetical protein